MGLAPLPVSHETTACGVDLTGHVNDTAIALETGRYQGTALILANELGGFGMPKREACGEHLQSFDGVRLACGITTVEYGHAIGERYVPLVKVAPVAQTKTSDKQPHIYILTGISR